MSKSGRGVTSPLAQETGFGGLIPLNLLTLTSWLGPVVNQPGIRGALLACAATITRFVDARTVQPRLGLSASRPMRLRLTAVAALSWMVASFGGGRRS